MFFEAGINYRSAVAIMGGMEGDITRATVNRTVWSSYDVNKYPHRAHITLQGQRVTQLTMAVTSGSTV